MQKFQGKIVSSGIAIGKIMELRQQKVDPLFKVVEDSENEKLRFASAVKTAINQLDDIYIKALEKLSENEALIFDIHKMMLEDSDFLDSVTKAIDSGKISAEYAVSVTRDKFSERFLMLDDDYMKARSVDIIDISNRVIDVLLGYEKMEISVDCPCIIAADDLSPSQTLQMDNSKVLAFVTRKGSVNSHTAILSRSMGIPAIVSVDFPENLDEKIGIVDAFKGVFTIEPTEQALNDAKTVMENEEKNKNLLLIYKEKKAVTKSGKNIDVFANVGSLDEINRAIENGADGIGLFRTEFLYLMEKDYPTEQFQFDIYKKAALALNGKPLVIRTADLGSDKQAEYFNFEKEENPALGYRGIRVSFDKIDMFKTQLRAIIRASSFGKISLMLPMISSVWEVLEVKKLIEEIKSELLNENIEFGLFEFGIMVETPAAVVLSEELAKHVDFFSIGSNDLTQYTLAVDRQNARIEKYFDSAHPAVLKMIELTVKSAKRNGIWVGICGEVAANKDLTQKFIEMEIDELSVNPSSLLLLKEKICNFE